ncbi:MAG TPA: helix-turn-helix domain-containing protein, partial [Myxococcales bacterium]|nr:helix-turn-helix domain-containing protein [Myxococcales bacterium]
LQANKNNRSQTARALGVGRTTLLSKLKKYGLATGDETVDEPDGNAA